MIKKRSANILVFNKNHELALQLRAAHDGSYPSHWDFSAAGGIEEGEEPATAAARELKEELGITAYISFVTEITCIFPTWGTNEPREDYVYLYKAEHDGEFFPDPNEVQEARFFSLEAIDSMIFRGEKFHPEFKMIWSKRINQKLSK